MDAMLKKEISVGASGIIRDHLEEQTGFRVENVITFVTDNLLITHVPTLPAPPKETQLPEGDDISWFQRYFENLLIPSEGNLRERLVLFLKRPVGKIHYVVTVKGNSVDIVTHLAWHGIMTHGVIQMSAEGQ